MSDEKKYDVPPALPVSWHGGSRDEPSVAQSQSPIVTGSAVDEMRHVLQTGEVCGNCKYFSLAQGQALMQGQRFIERLVKEDNWQVRHLASPVNALGVCGAHTSGAKGEEEMLTGRLHKACDQFRPDNGSLSRAKRSTDER